eukprot:c9467_g1_i1.p1 GENE.c9467_g1_i1~~c9467_g1_i1.p1  ORF type:complete len:149 (+),score=19.40 c9467_g1_i1:424-870(+)
MVSKAKQARKPLCIATQDRQLQSQLHELGGVPILFIQGNTISLASPPNVVKQLVIQEEQKFGGLMKIERRALAEAKWGTSTKKDKPAKKQRLGPNPLANRPSTKKTHSHPQAFPRTHSRHRSRAQKRASRLRSEEAQQGVTSDLSSAV